MKKIISLIVLSSALFVTACSTNKKCHDCKEWIERYSRIIVEREAKAERISRALTLQKRTNQLGGAAIRQDAYVHVLAPENKIHSLKSADQYSIEHNQYVYGIDFEDFISNAADWDNTSYRLIANDKELILVEKDANTNNSIKPVVLNNIQSNEQLKKSRWARYCNFGFQMNEKDFKFVMLEKYQVPEKFRNQCKIPNFNYEEYIAAWDNFCNIKQLTDKEKTIIAATQRPSKLRESCTAIIIQKKLLHEFSK